MKPSHGAVRWHTAQWGTLGWVETVIKACAFACAYAAFATSITTGWSTPGRQRLVELVLIGIAAVGLVAAIGDRLIERERIAMVFVVFNNLAHLAILTSLVTAAGPGRLLATFAVLMACGELVKIWFLRSTGFAVRDVPAPVVVGLSAAYAAVYALAALTWTLR